MATSEEVTKQWFLNTSAILSFSNLVRKAQVNNDTAHNRYPSHAFGRLSPKNAKAVAEKYIPYLQSQLRKAVSQGDSPMIQVYIRALGNTAHPKILSVFEPYLEGTQQMSNFQRFTIVASLDKMTKTYPKLVRPVLYRIYQNAGDTTEIRVAAVMQLMKTNPPAQILQRMAENTNYDHDDNLNSAVKSAIESAANMRTSYSRQLSHNARSAVDMLTAKQFGVQYSKNMIRSYVVEQLHLAYKNQWVSVQNEDSLIPSSFMYYLRKNVGGFKQQEFQAGYLASNADDLIDLLGQQFQENQSSSKSSGKKSGPNNSGSGNSHWSVDKLANLLNIEMGDADQVEGNIFVSMLSGDKFFAFDNHTIEQIPRLIRQAASNLRSTQHFNSTKMYNQFSAKIGFPTATGLPFVFSFSVPSYVYIGGAAQAKAFPDPASRSKDQIQVPRTINATVDVKLMYSAKAQGKMGFITPYNHMRYTAALHKNVHLHLPLRASLDLDLENGKVNAEVQPLEGSQKHKLLEYSTVAYTVKHDILNLSPALNDNNAQPIHTGLVKRMENTVGQDSTGYAFDMKAETEGKPASVAMAWNAIVRHDVISALIYGTAENSIDNKNYTIVHNPQQSSAKIAKFTLAYNEEQGGQDASTESGRIWRNKHRGSQESRESGDNAAVAPSSSPDSAQRQQQFLRKAAAGIKDSYTQMLDMSVQFEGEHKAQYVATAAYARSPVSEKSKVLLFMSKSPAKASSNNKDCQVALQLTASIPQAPMMNFQSALNADPSAYFAAKLNFGEKATSGARVTIQGKLKRSSDRRDYVRQHPQSALCEQQMHGGNNVQYACRNATYAASVLNQLRVTVDYENVPQGLKNATYKTYTVARYLASLYGREGLPSPQSKNGQLQFNVDVAKDLKSVNVSLDTPILSAAFDNMPLNPYVAYAIAVHPQLSAASRIAQKAHLLPLYPTCSLDKNMANTFDNKSYPINLGRSWHVMAISQPKSSYDSNSASSSNDDEQSFSVLVREASSDKKEAIIVLGNDVVEIMPVQGDHKKGEVKFNGKKANFDSQSSDSFQDEQGETVAQVMALPTGSIVISAEKHGIDIYYDGQRLMLHVSGKYRGQMRGLCGTFNGEKVDDFTSPKNCILKNPYEFAASYAVPDSSLTSPAKELRQRAQNADCYYNTVMFGNVINENGVGHPSRRGSKNAAIGSVAVNKLNIRQ